MKLEMLENGNILVEKEQEFYLIDKFRISGTLIDNYGVYKDIYGDLEFFKNGDNNEKYYCGDYATLEQALMEIYLGKVN